MLQLFCRKFNRFPAVKEFCKSVKMRRRYRHKRAVRFLGHSVDTFCNLLWVPGSTYCHTFCTIWWSDVRCMLSLQ